jgi:ribosomal-protein-alanine N-acetyltransferase
LAGDNRIAKETLNIRHPYEDGMAEKWISSLDSQWEKRERAEFAIVLKEESKYIGSMSFVSINGDKAEIGYWIGFPYWNNGYCTEAGKVLVEFGLTKMCLSKITARHLSTNPKSGKVLENLGLIWKESEYRNDRNGKSVQFEFYETPDV